VEFHKILVPVGGTTLDEDALDLAISLARKNKAKVLVIYVVEVGRGLPLDVSIAGEMKRGNQVLNEAEERATEADYEVVVELVQSRDVGPAIVDEAVEKEVDLVVIGIPYKRRFGEFDLGRVVPYVLKNVPCRLLVLREPGGGTG
jgi:nucleotide-binding universal stress UspA family protein